jgi:N-acetylglucosaminyldiphosphoundecaprenol N-acetyl-beta-D-mannosaminyltransferase
MREISAFNIKIHPLTRSEFLSVIHEGIKTGKQVIQIGVNSASFNELSRNSELREAINKADLVNIDGISVAWALRLLGHKIPERVATPDLADDLLGMAEREGYSVFLLGAKETTILSCRNRLLEIYPELTVAGFRNGYFQPSEEPGIVEYINASKPDILLIGMPSPQKEMFFSRYGHLLTPKYILGVGGYFDIMAGLVRRAPEWIQNVGMEWFYRFSQEPKRLWRRYLLGSIIFFWLTLKEKFIKN